MDKLPTLMMSKILYSFTTSRDTTSLMTEASWYSIKLTVTSWTRIKEIYIKIIVVLSRFRTLKNLLAIQVKAKTRR